MDLIKWLKPGLGIKRWIILGILGLFLFSMGTSSIFDGYSYYIISYRVKALIVILGLFLIILAIKKIIVSVLTVVSQYSSNSDISKETVNKMLYKERILIKGPKVVVIGGGTGLSVLLRGLKEFTSNITAIVTVADDGGGSGILREDLGMLPPGDIRSCILALANTEPTMEKLMQYRFEEGKLKGQNFGNLFIAAMNGIHGNFERAIKEMSNVLAVTGRVLPMTLEDVRLLAKLENGEIIEGESNIPIKNREKGSRIDHVFIEPKKVYPIQEAIEAIKDADCIVLGPGSLYTSVIPNLLVKDICGHIHESLSVKIYVPNIMTQPGETDNYNVLNHVEAILKHSKDGIIDYVITNVENIPMSTLNKYYKDGAKQVLITDEQIDILKNKNIEVIKDKLIDIKKNYIRHDALKLSEIITKLAGSEKFKKARKNLK